MKFGQLIGILIILVLILLGASFFLNERAQVSTPEPFDPNEKIAVSGSGSFLVNTNLSQVEWIGRKKFLDYEDVGAVSVKVGEIFVDDGMISSGEIVFDMRSIQATSTGSGGGRDRLIEHLKSDDFFSVESYPESTFIIKSSTTTDELSANLVGDLTIKDTTQEIEVPVKFYDENGSLVMDIFVDVDRSLFDIRYGSDSFFDNLGDNVIDDIFTIKAKLVSDPVVDVN